MHNEPNRDSHTEPTSQSNTPPNAESLMPNPVFASDLSNWLYQGKPLKVLSTSLGVALALHLILAPIGGIELTARAEGAAASASPSPASAATGAANTGAAIATSKLVEWSNEDVKKYYDANLDWNIPVAAQPKEAAGSTPAPSPGSTSGSGGNTTVVNNYGGGFGSGFGWDDLLLYHLIFNSGRPYSTSGYYNNSRPAYVAGTQTPYKAKSFDSQSFQNKPVAGSAYAPRTSVSGGAIVKRSSTSSGSTSATKSTSSQPGGIGGKSSGVSSSSSSSSSSSGGFGG